MIYDAVIMRTIVDLPPEQIAALSDLCGSLGISRAEAVRRALAQMLEQQTDDKRDKAFGAWKHKQLNPSDFVRELREEWDS